MFDLLENAGALVSSVVTAGNNTLLHWFCYKKEIDECMSLLKKLIDKEFDINAQNWQQRTSLMIAVKNNMTNTCRLLIENGADMDKQDYNGHQAIDFSLPDSECSKILLHATNTEKLKLQLHNRPDKTIVRRQRIDVGQSRTINNDEINNEDNSSKHSDEEKRSNASPHPYIYPNRLKDHDEIETNYERVWDKPLQKKRPPRLAKTLNKEQSYSVDTEDISRL